MSGKCTSVIVCSDVHLCYIDWYGCPAEKRLQYMVEELNLRYRQQPYEKILFLGDYSLDHWAWDRGGSVLNDGVSNTANFIRDFASRLDAPYAMIPGNHEQYGDINWCAITGTNRQLCFTAGGYLFICCDTFGGDLDPAVHSDGTYTPCDLDFVRACLEEHPGLPAILCAHYFHAQKEPAEFFDFLAREKRITLLMAGHTHSVEIVPLGDAAGNVQMYLDGNFSYAPGIEPFTAAMWGYSEVNLTEDGVEITYIEPENTVVSNGEETHHPRRERKQGFFPRRDLL